jgi:hypothetical protein
MFDNFLFGGSSILASFKGFVVGQQLWFLQFASWYMLGVGRFDG